MKIQSVPKQYYRQTLLILGGIVGILLLAGLLFSVWAGRAEERKQEQTFRLQSPEAKAVRKKWEGELSQAAGLKGTSPNGDEALIRTARALDALATYFYEDADHKCYFYKKRDAADPACFEQEVVALNGRYGAGAFIYLGDEVEIRYTGLHYRKIVDEFPKSRYLDEASFQLLKGRELVGNEPEIIFAKVDGWIKKYPKSSLVPEAWLLLGRLYADGWWLFKTRTFVAINMSLSSSEIDDLAQRYKGKGLWALNQVMQKFPNSKEANVARREYDLLTRDQNDGVLYGLSY
ncbi:MAG: hypothetical protein Q7S98_04395 [Deltaproteobacteria bacterium]|nr:hypothetical protein [Deltaproteobacteria bacterium]